MHTRSTAITAGITDMLPLLVGAAPFGLIFGALALNAGLSPLQTFGMSLLVFAGSAQFIAVSLLAAGVSLPVLWLTTLVVNLRHALYSASVQPHIGHWPARWRYLLSFVLTDELFAVFDARLRRDGDTPTTRWYLLGCGVAMYGTWLLATLAGIALGQQVPQLRDWGLEFAMVATFAAIVAPQLRDSPVLVAALTASACALLLRGLPYKLDLLLAALFGILGGILTETLLRRPAGELQA
ncbi:AzlC family ABC transporter permease [Chitinilyticum litopenaei]|uniref:AzlC family ABC transporter permease n=1 Tax=Chitinilyticum litopenaei TaxID=1121276 RepID=UPI00040CEE3B|nr:AzlC family ABC transporter permease [Chitinilyticum litopenaei]